MMNKASFNTSDNANGPDKVDMSLDDIIRLNKKQSQKAASRKRRLAVRGHLIQGRRVGDWAGAGVNRLFGRGWKVPARRGQGVITGLAARKAAALMKGVSPLNRPALSRKMLSRPGQSCFHLNRSALAQRAKPFILLHEAHPRRMQEQRWPYTQMDRQNTPGHVAHRPFQLRRKWNAPQVHESQREARQATFLSRRGLKVHTRVQKTTPGPAMPRTRPWRTPLTTSGILTVSIDNPTARTQPEPAHSWSLHPQNPALTPTEAEPEKKSPKGVALQFDINSVGKQTSMTLNERFRILKDKRVTAAQQSSKGGRFVTVG
ncbi:UAP56-interacting factor-like isoform X2 [Electrophorus electricus]|uniref:UAP56-interacting factor-like isoform X2 n=1 Tax=Electrophorus electricus TaxID=8005 RepID=UPI0015D09F4C|nr:UAP56-interacting factor-like isoform X2 [Electrophorus electricus]